MNDAEFASRRREIAAALARVSAGRGRTVRVDALLVAGLPNIRYLTGFTGSNALLLVEASGEALLFTDPRYRLQAASEVACAIKVAKGPILPHVVRRVERRRIKRLGFEASRIGFEAYEHLKENLPATRTLEPVRGLIEKRRMRKSPAEIELVRRSVATNSEAFSQVLRLIRPGRTTEAELAAELDYRMRRLGAEKPAFDTIVVAGGRTAHPHARPSGKVLGANELLLIDVGAFQDGYASDMTRVLFLGRAGNPIRRVYGAVLDAQLAAIQAVKPGARAAEVDRRAREVLRDHSLDRAFVHSTGHGLGLEIHEPPRLGRRERTRLEEGMTITIEPGAYVEGVGGVRIEDTVLVTRDGCEVLTPTKKELLEI